MANKVVHLLGIPMSLGQTRRGVDLGPYAIRYAGLSQQLESLGYTVRDEGNVDLSHLPQEARPCRNGETSGYVYNLKEITEATKLIYDRAASLINGNGQVIFLGGDHSLSIGTVSAAAQDDSVGVIWIDAHGDINTPQTSPSGNLHGMVIATLLGDGPEPFNKVGGKGAKIKRSQLAYIGLRDLDPPERARLSDKKSLTISMRDIDDMGITRVAARVLSWLGGYKRLHISLDADALDPAVAPGVGTSVQGGLSHREAHLLMELLGESGKVRSLDIVEVNPILDHRNQTSEAVTSLAATLLGKRIL